MKVVEDWPPNIDLIRLTLSPTNTSIFCYGDTIYNPGKRQLTKDLLLHEETHSKQQGDNPDAWYAKYLQDRDFRLSQEIEAYGKQWKFAKQEVNKAADEAAKENKVLTAGRTQLLDWLLENMALALSGKEYGTLITYGAAKSKIRNYQG